VRNPFRMCEVLSVKGTAVPDIFEDASRLVEFSSPLAVYARKMFRDLKNLHTKCLIALSSLQSCLEQLDAQDREFYLSALAVHDSKRTDGAEAVVEAALRYLCTSDLLTSSVHWPRRLLRRIHLNIASLHLEALESCERQTHEIESGFYDNAEALLISLEVMGAAGKAIEKVGGTSSAFSFRATCHH
jgi:hypothetical protein